MCCPTVLSWRLLRELDEKNSVTTNRRQVSEYNRSRQKTEYQHDLHCLVRLRVLNNDSHA